MLSSVDGRVKKNLYHKSLILLKNRRRDNFIIFLPVDGIIFSNSSFSVLPYDSSSSNDGIFIFSIKSAFELLKNRKSPSLLIQNLYEILYL